jgi:excisionase family DNA binding protein
MQTLSFREVIRGEQILQAVLQYKEGAMAPGDAQTPGKQQLASQTEPLLVRVEEAARLLCLSRSTIYEMLESGELPSVRRGAARRIPIAALHTWVEQQMRRGTS